jgi:simple sugar transport system permease protein
MRENARKYLLRPEATALAALVGLFVIFTAIAPSLFPTKVTFVSVMAVAAELGIISIGVTLLMIGGHFDLSVGSVLGLCSFVVVSLMRDFGFSAPLASICALGVGALLGFINGLLVTRFNIHSFVVTLGAMFVWRGVTTALTGGFPIMVEMPELFQKMMSDPLIGGFRMSLLWLVAVAAGGTLLLYRTRFGNWVQAIGQNANAARNLGVPVERVTVMLFVLTSTMAALAGVVQVARFSSVDALRGTGMELQAVAVTVIGGTLLSGGYGSPIGTLAGAVTFGMIQVGLVLAGAPGYLFMALTGVILVVAVIVNARVGVALLKSRPLRGYSRSSADADAAIRQRMEDDNDL